MDLLYFVILISVLIFVHESGHFAFAKIFGVKVITFSIGFGPKIVRLRGKETEYCIGILPFGGFVKMLEESKRSEPLLPEEKHRTFESKANSKRRSGPKFCQSCDVVRKMRRSSQPEKLSACCHRFSPSKKHFRLAAI